MQKHPTSKGPPSLAFSKLNKKAQKTLKNVNSQVKQKISVKTSLEQKLRSTEQFLKVDKGVKILVKSAQELSQKNIFKNSQIKKSIELLKNNMGRVMEKSKEYEKSIASDQKGNRDAYYGNTTTSQTKSNKRSSKSKFSERSKQSSPQISVKPDKPNGKRQPESMGMYNSKSPNLHKKKQYALKNKERKRLKKLPQQIVKMLEDKLEQKQAQLNTIRTRNMLEETRGLGGWADGLRDQELKRLIKIHRTEEEICEERICSIKEEIRKFCNKEQNSVLCFGGSECEDVLSFIEGKD